MNVTSAVSFLVNSLVMIISSAPILEFFSLILASAVIRIVINMILISFKRMEG